ncbi:helix-turn-helix domain-containing protein [Lentilactobacillus otakiensis]|uniref:helix-turn-helix domain-containing protein n=1 Tax=Lentilactobacillus otakiensis TaxID=481720 RepID=UPI003D16B6FA
MAKANKNNVSKQAEAAKDTLNEFTSPGMRIKKIRVENSMTQQQFADVLNELTGSTTILKGSVNNWEHDRNLPNKKRLGAIAHLGNTSVSSIVSGRSFGQQILINESGMDVIKTKVKEALASQGEIQLTKKDEELVDSFIGLINALKWSGKTTLGKDLDNIIKTLTDVINTPKKVNVQKLSILFIEFVENLKS